MRNKYLRKGVVYHGEKNHSYRNHAQEGDYILALLKKGEKYESARINAILECVNL